MPICPEDKFPSLCPVGALQQYVEATQWCNWDMSAGYLFPDIEVTGPIQKAKRSSPVSPQNMTSRLKTYAKFAGLAEKDYTMHSFRVGSAVSRALQGRTVFEIMHRVFWKSENVARRYVGLGAVSPKNRTEIGKLSEEQYDWIDKFAATGSCAEHALFPRTSSSSPG